MRTKLILDPGLFEIATDSSRDDQVKHFEYLIKNIKFVGDCFDASLDQYNGAPYHYFFNGSDTYVHPPITKSLTIKNNFTIVHKMLQRMIRNGDLVDVPSEESKLSCPLQFESNTVTEMPFKHYLQLAMLAIEDNSEVEPLLLLSMYNKKHAPQIAITIEVSRIISLICVGDPATDCNGVIYNYLCKNANTHSMFPQDFACCELNDKFLDEASTADANGIDRQTLYRKYGDEVASRNGYVCRADLSRKNPNYCVFIHSLEDYYLSIDLLHGGLEVFKCRGQDPPHLGEYNFACIIRKGPEPQTHKINI
ncbi:hypothetical protein [Desulfosporosinus sp. SB140]|uniref:hypothetical protein n=1 Tax=Desulfosporosinus paludis TaxID=3115649 RepID=UPI00388F2CEF